MQPSGAPPKIGRVYDPPDHQGERILVDRLWPRGLTKEAAELDQWCKAIAPSDELRRWYGHDPERFEEFAGRYRVELELAVLTTRLDQLAERGRALGQLELRPITPGEFLEALLVVAVPTTELI